MLSTKVLETMKRFGMILPNERVVVGISGGGDSVALSALLVELAPELGLSLALAHLNHGLRPEADEDEAFCKAFAASLSLPFVRGRIDLAAEARCNGRSIEDEGRRARYRFLESERARLDFDRIAVGHTLDDQAETFLLRLFRGSGGRGLASAYPVVGRRRIRPLIELRRKELAAYLSDRGLSHRDDPSNQDPRFTRNRVRHTAIPRLIEEYNPRLIETLGRTVSILRDEEDWMDLRTREAFSELSVPAENGAVNLDVEGLTKAHPALRRRIVRLALEGVRGDLSNVTHVHIEGVLSLLGPKKSGREVHLPGMIAERAFGALRIRSRVFEPSKSKRGQIARERGYNGFEYHLMIPARIRIPEGGGTLSSRVSTPNGGSPQGPASPPAGNTVTVGIEGKLPQLKVRSPRPGDRFHPLGAPGSKPLSRYLMDRKVARGDRRTVPVVVGPREDGKPREEILWVVGHSVSERSRVSRESHWVSLEWVTG